MRTFFTESAPKIHLLFVHSNSRFCLPIHFQKLDEVELEAVHRRRGFDNWFTNQLSLRMGAGSYF
jgi:hypothetical protein